MNKKEEQILKAIREYIKENKIMPTRRFLQKKMGFKSVNSITQYLKSLEKRNYLTRNMENKIVINESSLFYEKDLKRIKIINSNNSFIHLFLNKSDNYIGYKIHNNFFLDKGIIKNDILIIKINKNLQNNDLGLFIIDNKYRVMKYNYKDGFYYLTDNEEIILNKVKLIGKVIIVEKNFENSQSFNNKTCY